MTSPSVIFSRDFGPARRCALLSGFLLAAGGCAFRGEDRQAVADPQRAAFDRLEAFVGRWKMDGVLRHAGAAEPLQLTGRNEAGWTGDRTLLVGQGASRVGSQTSHGWAAWTYDPQSAVYRCVLIDSNGTVGTGTASFEADTETWHNEVTSHGPSGPLRLEGHIRFRDCRTKDEQWRCYDANNTLVFELQKTERRR